MGMVIAIQRSLKRSKQSDTPLDQSAESHRSTKMLSGKRQGSVISSMTRGVMKVNEEQRMILDALRDAKDDARAVSSDYRETREAMVRVTTEQKNNKEEIDKARIHREKLERRVTVIESQTRGAEKTGANVAQYVGILLAIAAGVMSLVGLLK